VYDVDFVYFLYFSGQKDDDNTL